MKKIDLIMTILLEEQNFRLLGRDFNNIKGIEFFEIINFDCSEAIISIIGEDFFGENYYYNVDPFIEGWESEEDFKLKMIEWDITLLEEISPKLKSSVIEKLLKVKSDVQLKIIELNEYGIIFKNIDTENLFEELHGETLI